MYIFLFLCRFNIKLYYTSTCRIYKILQHQVGIAFIFKTSNNQNLNH